MAENGRSGAGSVGVSRCIPTRPLVASAGLLSSFEVSHYA